KLRVGVQRLFQDGMGNGLIVQQSGFLCVSARGQPEGPRIILQEHVAALGARELQRGIEKGNQNFVENAASIQFARCIQKQSELFQVPSGDVAWSGNLAEKFSRGIEGTFPGIENDIDPARTTKFQPIPGFKVRPPDTVSIYKCAMLAALVNHSKLTIFGKNA